MQFKTAKLTKDDQKLYDDYLREKELAKGASTHDEARKKHQNQLVKNIGEFTHGRLPDGRVIQIIPKSRPIAAKAAYEQKWVELHEVQLPESA